MVLASRPQLDPSRAVLSRKARMEIYRQQAADDRSTWEPFFRDVERFISPMSTQFEDTEHNIGRKRGDDIIDSTATFAKDVLSSGFTAGVTSPARPWVRFTLQDQELAEMSGVKEFLVGAQKRILAMFAASNLYNVLPILYEDLGTHGVGAMIAEEDGQDIMRFTHLIVGSYALATDRKHRVNGMVREYVLTVAQIMEEFDFDNIPIEVKNQAERGNWLTKHTIIHIVAPNDLFDPDKFESKFKRFTSTHYMKARQEDEDFLRESGTDRFMVLAPRWKRRGNNVYGDSPARTIMGDVKQLQKEESRKLRVIDNNANPAMQAPASMMNQPINLVPGKVTFVPSTEKGEGIRRIFETDLRIGDLVLDENLVRGRINRAFFVDLFLALLTTDRRQITAREVEERVEERLLMLGPVLESLNDELLDPLIDLAFDIMLERGMLGEVPEELAGQEIVVEYISILAQAQKLAALGATERLLAFVAQLSVLFPEIVDNVDFDNTVRDYADVLGSDPDNLRSPEEVQERREIRAERQAQQEQAQSNTAAIAAAKSLSETKVTEDTLLNQVAGAA